MSSLRQLAWIRIQTKVHVLHLVDSRANLSPYYLSHFLKPCSSYWRVWHKKVLQFSIHTRKPISRRVVTVCVSASSMRERTPHLQLSMSLCFLKISLIGESWHLPAALIGISMIMNMIERFFPICVLAVCISSFVNYLLWPLPPLKSGIDYHACVHNIEKFQVFMQSHSLPFPLWIFCCLRA